MTTFADELRCLISRYSRENDSNTPDFILAEYIESSLNAFESATRQRDNWYGIKPAPGKTYVLEPIAWPPGVEPVVAIHPTPPDEKQAPELVEGSASTIPAPESISPIPLPSSVPEIPKFFHKCMEQDHDDDEGSIG